MSIEKSQASQKCFIDLILYEISIIKEIMIFLNAI